MTEVLTEEAPLCVCGKPRKWSKDWLQTTGSNYYVTCGDHACSNKNRRKLTDGKKFKRFRFGPANNPDKICARAGCGMPVGGGRQTFQRRFCSNECRLVIAHQANSEGLRREHIRKEHRNKYLSEIYADIKAGATRAEIRRKYRLDSSILSSVIESATSNREKQIRDRLNILSREVK